MIRDRVVAATFLSSLVIVCGSTFAQQHPSSPPDEVNVRKPGMVSPESGAVVVTLKPGMFWLGDAADELATRHGKILVRCGLPDQVGEVQTRSLSGRSIQLPDNLDGIRQIAALSDSEVVELSPEVLLLRSRKGDCDEPLTITAEHVPGMGVPIDRLVDVHALDVRLFQTGQNRLAGAGFLGWAWDAIYYWASHEGVGREIYVQEQSSTGLGVNSVPGRLLRKVAIEDAGGTLEISDLWMDDSSNKAGPRLTSGPAAKLEVDFDGDGVVDVVCFSGVKGEEFGTAPLVVLSGKNGREIGKLDGYEFVVTEDASGQKRVTTLGREGYRRYEVDTDGRLTLRSSAPLDEEEAKPLLGQSKAGRPTVTTLGLKAADRVIADFVLPHRPSNLVNPAFQELKVLQPIGERMSLPPGGVKALQGARVLLNYQPGPKGKAAQTP